LVRQEAADAAGAVDPAASLLDPCGGERPTRAFDVPRTGKAGDGRRYRRIYRRLAEDPGTACDKGKANWTRLLTDWPPGDVHVVTRGRILAADGCASPQVDVVVLAGDYPSQAAR
jgi:hypothetical protein